MVPDAAGGTIPCVTMAPGAPLAFGPAGIPGGWAALLAGLALFPGALTAFGTAAGVLGGGFEGTFGGGTAGAAATGGGTGAPLVCGGTGGGRLGAGDFPGGSRMLFLGGMFPTN